MNTQDFFTIDDIAKTLRVTRQTVAKFIKDKKLNAIKMNKSYRVHNEDFETFINQNITVAETKPIYYKKSRNCFLEYENKSDIKETLYSSQNSRIEKVEINHAKEYNKFIFGDNLLVLKQILNDIINKVDLIYIDPPFGTGQEFSNMDRDLAYSDNLVNHQFLDFLRKRLILLKECLSEKGSIYLHIDKKIGHYVKIIMDEIFGYENFLNDITRLKCNPKNFARNAYGNYSDMILFYAKKRDYNIWNEIKEPLSEKEIEKFFQKTHPKLGRYTTNPLHAPGETLNGDTGKEWNGLMPPKGRHWRYSRKELSMLELQGLVEWSETGNPRKKVFAKDHKGKKIQDVWEFKDRGMSYVSYPTEKNQDMLKRIILNSSNENSLVLDCFAGSGSTLIMADKLKRKWIGIDSSIKSLEIVKKNFKEHNIFCNYYSILALD